MINAEKVCDELSIDFSKVVNIYPYGSKIYGTANEESDDDFVIVCKGSFLPSGAFKDNAKSSKDWKIQGVCYSRAGFIDAINNYQINALECIFLPENLVLYKNEDFKMQKYNEKEMVKKIITTASSSWHFASMSFKDDNIESCRKNIFHALRILEFGLQIKLYGKIVNYASMNETKFIVSHSKADPKMWMDEFMELQNKLKM